MHPETAPPSSEHRAKDESPAPDAPKEQDKPSTPKLDPTRYGDWEVRGRCIDF